MSSKDEPTADLASYFDSTAERIHATAKNLCFTESLDGRASGGSTLVYCGAGVSRSPTLCLAYLVRYCGLTLRAAYFHLKRARPIIKPNIGFWRQLIAYECRLNGGKASVTLIANPSAQGHTQGGVSGGRNFGTLAFFGLNGPKRASSSDRYNGSKVDALIPDVYLARETESDAPKGLLSSWSEAAEAIDDINNNYITAKANGGKSQKYFTYDNDWYDHHRTGASGAYFSLTNPNADRGASLYYTPPRRRRYGQRHSADDNSRATRSVFTYSAPGGGSSGKHSGAKFASRHSSDKFAALPATFGSSGGWGMIAATSGTEGLHGFAGGGGGGGVAEKWSGRRPLGSSPAFFFRTGSGGRGMSKAPGGNGYHRRSDGSCDANRNHGGVFGSFTAFCDSFIPGF